METFQRVEEQVDRQIERRLLLAYGKVGTPLCVAYSILAILYFDNKHLDLIAAASVAATCLIAYFMARNGISRWGRAAIPLVLVVMFAALARIDHGVTSVVYSIMPAFVLIIRFLSGSRAAVAFLVVSLAWASAMVAMPELVHEPVGNTQAQLSRVVIIALSNFFSLWFAGIPAEMLRKALGDTFGLAADLERRVQVRTTSLESARSELKASHDELQRTNEDLEAFARSLTHDLRAPLGTIAAFTGIVLDEDGRNLSGESKEFLGRTLRATRRMEDLIDAMLEFSRSSAAPLSMSRIDLASIAREILEGMQLQEPDRRVEISVPDHAWCWADPVLMRTVLEILFSNAWKYSARREVARIAFVVESPSGLEFAVRDNGAGFDMAHVHKLFAHFSRLHSMEEFSGSGIGLANARRILERHGGWIRAEGETDVGATIRFALPPGPAPEA